MDKINEKYPDRVSDEEAANRDKLYHDFANLLGSMTPDLVAMLMGGLAVEVAKVGFLSEGNSEAFVGNNATIVGYNLLKAAAIWLWTGANDPTPTKTAMLMSLRE